MGKNDATEVLIGGGQVEESPRVHGQVHRHAAGEDVVDGGPGARLLDDERAARIERRSRDARGDVEIVSG